MKRFVGLETMTRITGRSVRGISKKSAENPSLCQSRAVGGWLWEGEREGKLEGWEKEIKAEKQRKKSRFHFAEYKSFDANHGPPAL